MKLLCKHGTSGVILRVKLFVPNNSNSDGKTGMTHASSGLLISTIADNEATPTVYWSGASNIETIATLGAYAAPSSGKCRFREVDATNHPGLYEIQLANARYAASGAKSLIVSINSGVSCQCDAEVQLAAFDPNDAVRGGLTALPNVASGSAGAIPTTGSGANQIQVNGSGAISSVISVTAVQDLLEADRWIDTGVSPWALVLIKKGSGALGVGKELLRQKLYDASGAAVSNANTILGRSYT